MSVIGYCRVSTNDQTITNQQQQITESGYQVTKWFTDNAVSGAVKASERQGFSDMLNYVREGDTLVCAAIDRLGRNTIDVLQTVELLHLKGVKVISLREGFDLSTPVGKAMLTMMASLASLEKDLIAERRQRASSVLSLKGFTVADLLKLRQNRLLSWLTLVCHHVKSCLSYR